jgi:hypothetical protein
MTFAHSFLALAACLGVVVVSSARAANPPPTQLFYIPFAEDNQLAAFESINGAANDPLAVFVTFSVATAGTVIYYDHWEDGYEIDITDPVQPTTLVFGDGDASNGFPPGNPGDLLSAGAVFNLRNFVTTTTLQEVVDYDGRDKVATFKPISLTKTTFPTGTNTLLAGCVEVFEYGLWGTEYRSPVGEDMPTSTASGSLAFDENLFNHNAISIMAGPGGATVQIDKDNDGTFEETLSLGEGETAYRDGVDVGGRVVSDRPIQTVLFNGTVGSNYASRDTNLLPIYRWSSDYFCPVSTRTSPNDGTVTFLYNPGSSDITVNYDYRDSASSYVTNSVIVPAGGNARVVMQPAGTGHFGAYRFYTTGVEPPLFYAFSAIDADASSGNNQNWDGGFTLVGRPSLTTQALLSLGIGRDPYSSINPDENGNPVWATSVGNGNALERIYVDYNGDNAGALTDPNGNRYDVHYDVRELEQMKLFDPDGDQSGMLLYSLNPAVRIAAVWGQDPSLATFGQPGIDVASLIPPLREGDAGKKSTVKLDADGDGELSAGDTLEIDIRAVSNARATIPGPFNFQDNLPADLAYVAGSARFRYSVGGNWQAWTAIPDDLSGTAFPLDGAGYSVPGNLLPGQQIQVVFDAAVAPYEDLTSATIRNTGLVEISPYGLLLPIEWTDTVYGSISDTVWNDLNGNGIQELGENGIPGIRVWADLDNDGVQDPGEPSDTTDANGQYLLGGLLDGSYTVRVNPSDIAAINPGYGPSYDLDGVATSHSAVLTLAPAEKRVDADFGYRVGASVGDLVWMDLDGDRTQSVGEPGVGGVRVYVDLNGNGSYDVGDPNTITSIDGTYYIGNLDPGTYTVRVDVSTLPAGAIQTHDLNAALDHAASVTLIAAEHRPDLDFGYRGNRSLGDLVWDDADDDGGIAVFDIINGRIDINNSGDVSNSDDGFINGVQIINGYVDINGSGGISNSDDGTFQGITVINGGLDTNNSGGISNSDDASGAIAGEAGIPGVRVYIDSNQNGVFDSQEPSAITDADGVYTIGNLLAGTYTVRVDTTTLPSSYVPTYDLVSPVGDHTATVILGGSNRTDVDFGYRNDASIGDLVWNDRNGNGTRDAGEPGIAGVLIYLDANGNGIFEPVTERSAITDLDGYYLLENLPDGNYLVRVDISSLPQGSTQTHDLDGLGTPHRTNRTLAVSEDATDADFGYRADAAFGDFVWNDLDGDGVQDAGEPGIAGVTVYADINGNGVFEPATEPADVTDSSGAYLIGNLVPGTYTARVATASLPTGMVQTFDAVGALDGTATFFVSDTQTRDDIDFGYTLPVTIGDLVWNDTNADGIQGGGESGIEGVAVTAYHAATDTIAATIATAADGSYSFTLMPGGYYLVFDTPAGHVRTSADQGSDAADSDADSSGRTTTVTLTSGQSDMSLDAGFYQPGAISGHVFAGGDPLAGVTLTLLDQSGNPVDGNPDLPGVQPVTTVTDALGYYLFTGLPPGIYQVGQTQPAGYDSFGDADGGDLDIIGDVTPIVVQAGQTNGNNDFIETLDTCPDDWEEWKFQHPGETPDGNPDADAYDNFAEFAFAMPYDQGVGSPWLGHTAWVIRPSTIAPGTLEGVFVRPKGAPLNTVYTLQYAAVPGNPTAWQEIAITPAMVTAVDNGDCTETVTIHDLENLTGLTGGEGVVRIKADLDDDGGNDEVDHTSFTEPEGWTETDLAACCQTYNNPYQRETVFSGTVSAVIGQQLGFAAADVLDDLLESGTAYYLEVGSGSREGHRFDVVSAAGNAITLAEDTALDSETAPFNTLLGPPPADLAGALVTVHRHRTIDGQFPPAAFGASPVRSSADKVQVFAGGSWSNYWLFDNSGAPLWLKAGENNLVDYGGTVLAPGQGLFFDNRNTAVSILAYGEVRRNPFVRPLAAGNNLVGGGFPLDQSANGRGMNKPAGFVGTTDFKTADSFFFWNNDFNPGAEGYSTYYLLDGAPSRPSFLRWVKVGDASLAPRDAEILLLGDRAAFIRSASGLVLHTMPSPWSP